jgi:peptidoglycan/xylan/chitin deacetylase (PgdA/CDA1 family)
MRRRLALLLAALALPAGSLFAIGQQAAAATNTVVSLTFDDGQSSQYSTLPMLQTRGMRGTYYINSGWVGTSDYYMTWPQIHDLGAAGNEIGGHTVKHTDLTSVSLTTAQHEVCDDRANLIAQGFAPPVSFAYPYAAYNTTAEQVVQGCGYLSARGVGGVVSGNVCNGCPYAETIPPQDAFALQTPEAGDSSTTLAQLQTYVTQAETHGGGWVILTFHGICSNSCTGTNSLSPSIFTAFLDWLQPRQASGTLVRTVGDVMGGTPPPPGPPITSINCNGTACSTGWYRTSSVTVGLTAVDPDGSAIASTRYTTDGSDPVTSATAGNYTGPFAITGTKTVRYYSTDVDGNAETAKSQLIQLDAAAPAVALTSPAAGSSYPRGASVVLTATATDNGSGGAVASGVASVVFRDGSTTIGTDPTAPYSVTWSTKKNLKIGSHTLTAVTTDIAGNTTTSAPVTVTFTR